MLERATAATASVSSSARTRSADLRLSDPTVSRFHCETRARRRPVAIRDLGSRNGTFVNGVSVIAAHLGTGSVVAARPHRARFDSGAPTPRSRAASATASARWSAARRRCAGVRDPRAAAASDVTVLIQGETGTGKDLAATSIHHASRAATGRSSWSTAAPSRRTCSRASCSATSAARSPAPTRRAQGVFEQRGRRHHLPRRDRRAALELQPKLLRVLEQREVRRVGGAQGDPGRRARHRRHQPRPRRRGPRRAVPLRSLLPAGGRGGDDAAAARAPRGPAAARARDPAPARRPVERRDAAARTSWPSSPATAGRATCASSATTSSAASRSSSTSRPRCSARRRRTPAHRRRPAAARARERWIEKFERTYLEQMLAAHGNNVTAAARAAGLNRAHFHRLLARHGIRGRSDQKA